MPQTPVERKASNVDSQAVASILGIPLHCVSMTEAVDQVARMIEQGPAHLVVTLGTEMVMNARHDPAFREVACHADLLVPDSIGVVWAARRQGLRDCVKVAGIDLMQALAAEGVQRGWRFFFLGGKPGVAEEASQSLSRRYPGLIVAGHHHGYFQDDTEVVRLIREARPHVLLAALGSPRQEVWCRQRGLAMGVPVAMGVGGAFDVLAGRVNRAPRWMIRLGLEWLYRLLKEPSRAARMLVLPAFALRVLMGGAAPTRAAASSEGDVGRSGPGKEVP